MAILIILIAAHFIGLVVLIACDPAHLLDAERTRRAKERLSDDPRLLKPASDLDRQP